jgi:hypothetical protein
MEKDNPDGIKESPVVYYYSGYSESLFTSDEAVCIVSGDMLALAENGVLRLNVRSKALANAAPVETELKIAGTVAESEMGLVYVPFSLASALGSASDGQPPHTESLRATIRDNRELVAFKETARRSFTRPGVFFNPRFHAMTIFDADFYDITEALMQTIFFIEITTPFVYAISVCVGFVASFLLTRRRKAEFANMRSVGVNKRVIFAGALFEQFTLCALGVLVGCGVYAFTWGNVLYGPSAIFLGCYTLGAIVSALKAAGTDVLKILREKE